MRTIDTQYRSTRPVLKDSNSGMTRSTIRKRKPRYTFTSIEGSQVYEEVKQLTAIPNNELLQLRSIFDALGEELSQVKSDISFVFEAVKKDVELECQQMEMVDLQLKKSVKRVNHMYNKVLSTRARNKCAASPSKILEEYSKDIQVLSNSLDNIDVTIGHAVANFAKVDARIPRKNRLLNGEAFNEQHYPLLFDLMHRKYAMLLISDETETVSDPIGETKNLKNSIKDSTPTPTVRSSKVEDVETRLAIDELITKYRVSQSLKPSSHTVSDVCIPPSLRRTSSPSTMTTFETISAKDAFKEMPAPNSPRT